MSLASPSSPSPLAPAKQNSPPSQPKKRTRVTPSQLSVLEETFAISATPDSKMRKQLAQKLQMPERSIQIWFQNRRAKVKMLQKRALMREEQEAAKARLCAEATAYPHAPYWYPRRSQPVKVPIQRAWSTDTGTAATPFSQQPPPPHLFAAYTTPPIPFYPASNPSLSFGNITEASPSLLQGHSLNDDSKSFQPLPQQSTIPPSPTPFQNTTTCIPGTVQQSHLENNTASVLQNQSLLQGMPSGTSTSSGLVTAGTLTIGTWHRMKITQQDLLCYYHLVDRTFEWHIRDNEYHFKMVISFDSVASIEIIGLDDMSGEVHIDLTEPPLFFMENSDSTWIQCSDFTEGMQASCVLRHSIRGLTTDLRQELLSVASADDGLCQITSFAMGTVDLGLATAPPSATTFNHSVLIAEQPWRHQSLPLGTEQFNWTQQQSPF